MTTLSHKIDGIEKDGSAGLKGHAALNEAQINGLDKRMANLEDAIKRVSSMEADIREIKTRVQFLSPKPTTMIPDVQPWWKEFQGYGVVTNLDLQPWMKIEGAVIANSN